MGQLLTSLCNRPVSFYNVLTIKLNKGVLREAKKNFNFFTKGEKALNQLVQTSGNFFAASAINIQDF